MVPRGSLALSSLHLKVFDGSAMDFVKAKAAALWTAAQVELQGQYSTQRVQALFSYSNESSGLRVLLLTPLPCLVVTTVVDLVHLRPISVGVHGSHLFFVRAFIAFWVASIMTYVQFKHIVASAPLAGVQIVGISAVVASLTVSVMYALALLVGFPLPFSIVTVSPAWVSLLLLPLVSWMKTVRRDPAVWPHVINSLKVMVCQETLIVIYPVYFYIFTTIPDSGKTAFALLLPIIKLGLRNWMANTVVHLIDEIPATVILNVEVFSALFVAYCMQNTPSVRTTFVLMAMDALQMSASLYDIGQVVHRMKTLRRQSEAKKTVQVRSRRHSVEFNLAQTIFDRQMKLRRPSSRFSFRMASSILKLSPAVHPLKASSAEQNQALDGPQVLVPSLGPRLAYGNVSGTPGCNFPSAPNTTYDFQYVQELRRVLYITEFVVLLNYVEVVIPLIFCKGSALQATSKLLR
jgi:hypothetical protein